MTQPQDAGWNPPPTQSAPPAPQHAGPPVAQAGTPQPGYGTPSQQRGYGTPPPTQPQPTPPQPAFPGAARPPMPDNHLGVIALVLGILGIVGLLFLGGIPAIILGTKARRAVRAGRADNDGLAVAGLVTGWIAVAFGVFWVLLYGFFMFLDAIRFGYG